MLGKMQDSMATFYKLERAEKENPTLLHTSLHVSEVNPAVAQLHHLLQFIALLIMSKTKCSSICENNLHRQEWEMACLSKQPMKLFKCTKHAQTHTLKKWFWNLIIRNAQDAAEPKENYYLNKSRLAPSKVWFFLFNICKQGEDEERNWTLQLSVVWKYPNLIAKEFHVALS